VTASGEAARSDGLEVFELELWGGKPEEAYRSARPEVDAMPWGTLDVSGIAPEVIEAARLSWTGAAFQEYRTGIACVAALRAMLDARAPLDLSAQLCRFPLDELVHVELCSRMTMELGGGVNIRYDPRRIIHEPAPGLPALLRAADLCMATFCVGEALSIPLIHGTWKAATHPLPKAILGHIVRDEADHGTYGWDVLDWADEHLTTDDKAHLSMVATRTIETVIDRWRQIRNQPSTDANTAHALGWMQTDAYLALAERSLRRRVLAPLAERGYRIDEEALWARFNA